MKNMFQLAEKHGNSIKLALGAVAIGLAARIVLANLEDFTRLLRLQPPALTAIIFMCILVFLTANIPLWLIIARMRGKPVPFGSWLKIVIVGRMANNLAPKSGGVYKAMVLKKTYDFSYTGFVQVYAFYSWLTILLNIGFAALLILIFAPEIKFGAYPAAPVMAGAAAAVLLLPIIIKRALALLSPRNLSAGRVLEKIQGVFTGIMEHSRDRKLMAGLTGMVFLTFGLNIILFKLLFDALDAAIGYPQAALFISLQQICELVFLTPDNIGVRELLYGVLGGSVGIGAAQGIIASALLRAANYILIFPLGTAFGGIRLFYSRREKAAP